MHFNDVDSFINYQRFKYIWWTSASIGALPKIYACSQTGLYYSVREAFFPNVTYIHNWPLQPFRQDFDTTTHVVCVNFIRDWWGLQFNVDSKRQIFERLFHENWVHIPGHSLKIKYEKYLFGNFFSADFCQKLWE